MSCSRVGLWVLFTVVVGPGSCEPRVTCVLVWAGVPLPASVEVKRLIDGPIVRRAWFRQLGGPVPRDGPREHSPVVEDRIVPGTDHWS
jgi:hypothetical protein